MKARTVGRRGEEGPLYDPAFELLLGREDESNARMIDEMKRKRKKNIIPRR